MIFCIIVMEKLQKFGLFMIVKSSFKATVLSSLLIVALFFFVPSSCADFQPDSSFVSVPAFTSGIFDLAAGAGIDSALGALGVKLALGSGAFLTTKDLIESVINGTPLGVPGYTYQGNFYSIVDQSTIRIRDDVVTIDGVDYKDVWLPHDAAARFRVNAFDFISFYNLVSESSGTYASGAGHYENVPLYNVNGVLKSSSYLCYFPGSFSLSTSIVVRNTGTIDGQYNVTLYDDGSSRGSALTYNSSDQWIRYQFTSASSIRSNGYGVRDYGVTNRYVAEPFDFTWTSSEIPAEPLPSDDGLRFRVPSSYVSSLPSVISPDLADYVTLINDLSNALEQARLADVVESTAFEPFDVPVPVDNPISDEPYSSLSGALDGIQDSLDNVDTNIGSVDESLDDIQVYAQDSAESLQSIDTNLSQSVADVSGIKGFIQSYLPGIHSFLNGISTSVSNIAGSIADADSTFFGNVVSAISGPFEPVFAVFRSGVGIWRYVVSWVSTISAPFSWSLSALGSAGSIFLSPIYACAAAAVVLAVYKKFGR